MSFKIETMLVLASLLINLGVMVGWFVTLENRLTRLETTIEIKLNNQPHFNKNISEHDNKVRI